MYSTLPQMIYEKAQNVSGNYIQFEKDKAGVFQPITDSEFADVMLALAAVLLSSGTVPDEHSGLISDNR